MHELIRHSPLADRRSGCALAVVVTPELRLEELTFGAALVRCWPRRNQAVAAAVARASGWTLPQEPNTVAVQPQGRSLWLEPGAWMITGERDTVAAALASLAALDDQSGGTPLLATDISAGRCMIGVSGPAARALLDTGCPLDLHPRVFAPGRCATSLFNEIPVLIDQLSDNPAYNLIADRALAVSLWDQLADAARWLE